MHIFFATTGTEQKQSNKLNGENIRYENGKGVSGTEQSMIIVAEQLAKHGHTCTIAFPKADNGVTYRGVLYIDLFSYWDKPKIKVDMIIITGWLKRFEFIFQKINIENVSKFGVWLPCQFYENRNVVESICNQMTSQTGTQIKKYLFHVSDWSRRVVGDIPGYVNSTISNALMTDIINVTTNNNNITYNNINITNTKEKEKNTYIFHACWERGGEVAQRVVNKMGGKLLRFDYTTNAFNMCKSKLFQQMKSIEYFVYPLVLPSGSVHKDTHACVVAEAMANGIIVLTYPVAALATSYPSNCIAFVDFPPGANIESLTGTAPNSTDPSLLSHAAVDLFCKKIKYLEENPLEKETLRENAREYVMKAFDENVIGRQFNDVISINTS